MTRRAPLGWYLGLIAIVVVPIAIAILLIWVSSGQQIMVNDFYTSQVPGDEVSTEEYRYWDSISRSAYQLETVVAPTLLTGSIVTIFALLAVLAFRSERTRQADEATAAS